MKKRFPSILIDNYLFLLNPKCTIFTDRKTPYFKFLNKFIEANIIYKLVYITLKVCKWSLQRKCTIIKTAWTCQSKSKKTLGGTEDHKEWVLGRCHESDDPPSHRYFIEQLNSKTLISLHNIFFHQILQLLNDYDFIAFKSHLKWLHRKFL